MCREGAREIFVQTPCTEYGCRAIEGNLSLATITDLSIRNLRGMKKCEISNLGQINLLIGKNSAGKSTMLEALQLVSSVLFYPLDQDSKGELELLFGKYNMDIVKLIVQATSKDMIPKSIKDDIINVIGAAA